MLYDDGIVDRDRGAAVRVSRHRTEAARFNEVALQIDYLPRTAAG
jgi:hypothetical protein